MKKENRKQFLNDNWRLTTLNFKYGSTGVVRIYDKRNNRTNYYAGGGGYDKQGTCLGLLITDLLNNEIKKLKSSEFYGLTHWNTKTKKQQKNSSKHTKSYLDGACGFNSMERILNKIGFELKYICESRTSTTYYLDSK